MTKDEAIRIADEMKLYIGKTYCHEENEYHYVYEKVHKGYDHLGSLGYETIKSVDRIDKVIKKDKITWRNIGKVIHEISKGNGWIE